MFNNVCKLNQFNPGLVEHVKGSDGIWKYATNLDRAKQTLRWYDNFIGGFISKESNYDFGYSIENTIVKQTLKGLIELSLLYLINYHNCNLKLF